MAEVIKLVLKYAFFLPKRVGWGLTHQQMSKFSIFFQKQYKNFKEKVVLYMLILIINANFGRIHKFVDEYSNLGQICKILLNIQILKKTYIFICIHMNPNHLYTLTKVLIYIACKGAHNQNSIECNPSLN